MCQDAKRCSTRGGKTFVASRTRGKRLLSCMPKGGWAVSTGHPSRICRETSATQVFWPKAYHSPMQTEWDPSLPKSWWSSLSRTKTSPLLRRHMSSATAKSSSGTSASLPYCCAPSSAGLHSSSLHANLLLPSQRVPLQHSFVKLLWPLVFLCQCWYSSPVLLVMPSFHRSCFTAPLSTLFPLKVRSCWVHPWGTHAVAETLKTAWQENQWAAKGNIRALLKCPHLLLCPLLHQGEDKVRLGTGVLPMCL